MTQPSSHHVPLEDGFAFTKFNRFFCCARLDTLRFAEGFGAEEAVRTSEAPVRTGQTGLSYHTAQGLGFKGFTTVIRNHYLIRTSF